MSRQPLKDKVITSYYGLKEKLIKHWPATKNYLSKNFILVTAIVAAIISCFFVPPNANYINYFNFKTLCTLLSLLLVTRAMRSIKFFKNLALRMLKKVTSVRVLAMILIFMPSLFALFITNDIAVLTFVPFTIVMLKIANQQEIAPRLIVLQIMGCNLSGVISPLGNAQNLYLYEFYGLNASWFILHLYPIAIASYGFLFLMCFTFKNKKIDPIMDGKRKIPIHKYIIYNVLFLICVLSVLKLINIYYTTLAVVIVVLIFDRKVFLKTNYSILILFAAFFIFVGNVSNMASVKTLIENTVIGNEFWLSVGLSQIISNTPTALLLPRFTTNYAPLITGIGVGKFGTIITSMSGYMAYSLYASSTKDNVLTKAFMRDLILYNIIFLIITMCMGLLLTPLGII